MKPLACCVWGVFGAPQQACVRSSMPSWLSANRESGATRGRQGLPPVAVEQRIPAPAADSGASAPSASTAVAVAPRLADLHVLEQVSEGLFGPILLVQHGDDKRILKILNKRRLLKARMERHTLDERHIMGKCSHPFIVRLLAAFQSAEHLYLMMDPLQGELFELIAAAGPFAGLPEPSAKFYLACIASALEFLQGLNVAHRDLKPENVLLDARGYAVLIDFGFAKVIKGRNGRTYCGTPHFAAPELARQAMAASGLCERPPGYDASVDLWAYGCLVYEVLVGHCAFGDNAMDQMQVLYRVLQGDYKFPPWLCCAVSASARELVAELLVTEPDARRRHLRSHRFFDGLDFDALEHRAIPPPTPSPTTAQQAQPRHDEPLPALDADTSDPNPASTPELAVFGSF